MNIKPFKLILAAALPTATLFMLHMPETVNEGVLLLPSLSGARLDPDLPGYKKAKFQAIVRCVSHDSGYTLAKQVMAAFKAVRQQTQSGMMIHYVEPMNDPVAFPFSRSGLIEFSVNFQTVYVEH